MSFERFVEGVTKVLSEVGLTANFKSKDGVHIAYCSDGSQIKGNSVSKKLSIRWGATNAHTAQFEL